MGFNYWKNISPRIPAPLQVCSMYTKFFRCQFYQQPLEVNTIDGTIKYNNPRNDKQKLYLFQSIAILICVLSTFYCVVERLLHSHHHIFVELIPFFLALYGIIISFGFLVLVVVSKFLNVAEQTEKAYNALVAIRTKLESESGKKIL